MTVFDYAFLSVLGLSAVFGLWRGLVGEILGLAAWVLALAAALRYIDVAVSNLASIVDNPRLRVVVAFLLILFAVLLLVSLVKVLLRRLLRAVGLGATDRLLGAVFGLVRGLVISFVLVWIGGVVGMSREPWWHQSLFAPQLEKAVNAIKPELPEDFFNKIKPDLPEGAVDKIRSGLRSDASSSSGSSLDSSFGLIFSSSSK